MEDFFLRKISLLLMLRLSLVSVTQTSRDMSSTSSSLCLCDCEDSREWKSSLSSSSSSAAASYFSGYVPASHSIHQEPESKDQAVIEEPAPPAGQPLCIQIFPFPSTPYQLHGAQLWLHHQYTLCGIQFLPYLKIC